MKHLVNNNKNFWLNAFDGAFFIMAMAMVPQMTMLPAYLARYTNNEYLINLIPAIAVLGFTLPQILTARHVESKAHRKTIMLTTAVFQRVPWLVLGLSVLLFPGLHPTIALTVFFSIYAFVSFSNGINIPIWLDLVAKLVPVNQRGRLFAYRSIIGGLLGLAGAALAKIILTRMGFPHNYGTLFLIYFSLTSVSWFFLFLLDEPASTEIRKKPGFMEYLKRVPAILSRDRNYRHFILSRIILALSGMATGLIAVYGIGKFGLRGKEYIFADISFLTTLISIVPIFIFARIGDRFGHKINMIVGPCIGEIAMILLLFMKSQTMFILVFILQGVSLAAMTVSGMNISVEFCTDADRPTYISVLNTLIAPFSFLAPIIGAFLARTTGYLSLFYVVIALQAFYIIYFTLSVKEPRKTQVQSYNISPASS